MTGTSKTLNDLREPFSPGVIGKLPKGNTTLDYVGHAAVTDRLLTVDPAWSWEPMATDDAGLPLYDKAGGLWIRLTVLGVTRLGYGDGPDPKQRIGDAVRNAAMRFGVALDLWTKGELESQDPNGGGGDRVRSYDRQSERPADRPAERGPLTDDQWASTPVAVIPVVTDAVWAKAFREKVAGCADLAVLRGLFEELSGQVKAKAVEASDATGLRALVEEQAADLTKQAERTDGAA